MSPTDESPNERVLDELLSADLDGELAAAAADLGLTLEAAAAAVASPAGIARRAELARASELVAAPVPLDPDVAERLVTTSINRGRQDNEVGAARQRRERRAETARRVLVAAGSAAAVIAVIVGLANMSTPGDNSDRGSSAMPIERSDSTNRTPDRPVALGDVSREGRLRRTVEYELRRAPAAQAGSETTAAARSSGQSSPTAATAFDGAAQRNLASCLPPTRATAGGSAPVLTGRGTSGGRPVNVYVFQSGNAYDVVVVGRDCTVVDRLSLP